MKVEEQRRRRDCKRNERLEASIQGRRAKRKRGKQEERQQRRRPGRKGWLSGWL